MRYQDKNRFLRRLMYNKIVKTKQTNKQNQGDQQFYCSK